VSCCVSRRGEASGEGWATKMACISSSAWQQQAVVVLFLIAVAASQCGAVRHMGTAPSVVKLSEHNLPGTTQVEDSRAAGHALANAKNTVQLTAAADDRYHDIGVVVVFEVAPLITQFIFLSICSHSLLARPCS